MRSLLLFPLASLAALAVLAGCGGKKAASSPPTSLTTAVPSTSGSSTGTTSSSPGALQAEANSAATGDIPDNQVFLTFHDPAAGFAMKYPEGWAQSGGGSRLTFRDKNNIVRVVVVSGARPTTTAIHKDLQTLKSAQVQSGPQQLTISGAPTVKVVYRTQSAANAVTGKRVSLTVDRYYLSHAGKEAIVDLGTPIGVDNVDAYRLMIESFRWK